MLAKSIADMAQQYSQFGGIRPFGCALFFIGIDASGPQIFTTSPSGIYRSFKAYALGSGEAAAREYLIENYKDGLTFEEIIELALKTLRESVEEDLTKENVRLAYIKKDEQFHMASKEEIEALLAKLE
ncbi:MAG TPA: hypothetical protein ENI29_13890 [bacterium]|nr:hypothetical protein [bacterium]